MSLYKKEQERTKNRNSLQISTTCNANCFFCCNKMGLKQSVEGFRNYQEIKHAISNIDMGSNTLRLFGVDMLQQGETLLHPQILNILRLVRDKGYKGIIEITTNGTLLTKNMIESLKEFLPLSLLISYNSHNPNNWSKIMDLSIDNYYIVRDSFKLLKDNGFYVYPSIIAMPSYVGYDDVEKTIAFLSIHCNNMCVSPGCYTANSSEDTKHKLKVNPNTFEKFIIQMINKYKVKIAGGGYEPLDFYPKALINKAYFEGYNTITWCFSEMVYDRAKKIVDSFNDYFPVENTSILIKNYSHGGNITATGHLTVADYLRGIKEYLSTDLIIIPDIAFDKNGDDMAGINKDNLLKLGNVWVI